MEPKVFGLNHEDLCTRIRFYNNWCKIVDEPEFKELLKKVELRELHEELARIQEKIDKQTINSETIVTVSGVVTNKDLGTCTKYDCETFITRV